MPKVAPMTDGIFHIVAEDPEVEHVSQDVREAAVHEHGGEERQENGNGRRL
jgi:hypothetical protein